MTHQKEHHESEFSLIRTILSNMIDTRCQKKGGAETSYAIEIGMM